MDQVLEPIIQLKFSENVSNLALHLFIFMCDLKRLIIMNIKQQHTLRVVEKSRRNPGRKTIQWKL